MKLWDCIIIKIYLIGVIDKNILNKSVSFDIIFILIYILLIDVSINYLYIDAINNEKGLVYDIYYKKFKSRIDVKKLDYEIYFEQNKSKFYIKIQSMFYHNKSLYLYVLVFVVFLYFIYTNQLNSKNDPRSFLEGYNSIKSLEYVRPKKY